MIYFDIISEFELYTRQNYKWIYNMKLNNTSLSAFKKCKTKIKMKNKFKNVNIK
jgi:hypothetical protein